MIQKLNLDYSSDQLILLGDYVNKGPDSVGTLDYIIELQKNSNVFCLIGNHDQALLNCLKSNEFSEGFENFENVSHHKKEQYIQFLESLSYYFILDEFIIVHAGFNFTLANPFLGKEEMLTIREFYYDSSKAQNKVIIHGHNPYTFSEIKAAVKEKRKIIPLDNGCVYSGKREDMGRLICLELDEPKLIWEDYQE